MTDLPSEKYYKPLENLARDIEQGLVRIVLNI